MEIAEAETRLGGQLPEGLRAWFREANGFEGLAEICMWQFSSLQELQTIQMYFSNKQKLVVPQDNQSKRDVITADYVIFCNAFFNLPFYAVNIRPESPYFSEVIACQELREMNATEEAWLAAFNFERFAEQLFQDPEEIFITADK